VSDNATVLNSAESGIGIVVPIAVTCGIVFPTVLGAAYGDVVAGYIYPGLVARILSAFLAFTSED
jgi:putative Ca2+/H+ antiporter (TMEM165/GDT1 family)